MLLNIKCPSPVLFNSHTVLRGGYHHPLPFIDKETESERSKGTCSESDVWKVVGLKHEPKQPSPEPILTLTTVHTAQQKSLLRWVC